MGWCLVVAGSIAVLAAFLPWFHLVAPLAPDAYGRIAVGDERGGLVSVLLGLAVLAAGAWVAVGRGDLWSPICALVASAVSIFCALVALAGQTVSNAVAFDNESTTVIAYGFWLEVVASAAGLVLAIVALSRRRPAG